MLTIEECKKLLNRGSRKYNEEEIRSIREFLYIIAEIENNDFNVEKDECDNLL